VEQVNKIVFFDVETSGLDPKAHDVIQIASIAVDESFEELANYHARVQFDAAKASPEALEVNHYTPEAWADAEPARVVVDEFAQFLSAHATVSQVSKRTGRPYKVAQLAGHNVATFDVPFLREMFGRVGQFCPIRFIALDTLQLAAWWVHRFSVMRDRPAPENLKLETLADHFGIKRTGDAHDALSDVEVTVRLAHQLLEVPR
jgi:DNA polymerase III epsilon subunit-like protein